LDIGSYGGDLSLPIKIVSRAPEVFGLDWDEELLDAAQKRGITSFKVDIDKDQYPFEADYFDAVFVGEVLEHLNDPDHALHEIYRILSPNGLLVITTPNFGVVQQAHLAARVSTLLDIEQLRDAKRGTNHQNAKREYSVAGETYKALYSSGVTRALGILRLFHRARHQLRLSYRRKALFAVRSNR
jgi:2-polyprenyl-3-methyl-5-hydroxy-6-metoxy-1,4-benzoquinol methylase